MSAPQDSTQNTLTAPIEGPTEAKDQSTTGNINKEGTKTTKPRITLGMKEARRTTPIEDPKPIAILPTWRRIVNRFTNELSDFYDELKSQVEDEEFENPMHCETLFKVIELKDLLKDI